VKEKYCRQVIIIYVFVVLSYLGISVHVCLHISLLILVIYPSETKDNLHIIFDPVNENQIPGKDLLKVVKFRNLVAKCCKYEKYCFSIWRAGNCYHFVVTISVRNEKICKLFKAISTTPYNIFPANFSNFTTFKSFF
jgi:hypothetical protein